MDLFDLIPTTAVPTLRPISLTREKFAVIKGFISKLTALISQGLLFHGNCAAKVFMSTKWMSDPFYSCIWLAFVGRADTNSIRITFCGNRNSHKACGNGII